MMDYYFNEVSFDDEDKRTFGLTKECNEIAKTKEEKWKLDFSQDDREIMQDELFYNLMNEIMEYLPANDLINLALISKEWLEMFGKLKTYSRVKLCYNSNKYNEKSDDEIEVIKVSKRVYENVDISIWNTDKEIFIAEQIINKYSPFLTCLKLIKYGGYNSMLNDPLDLPFLRELEIQVIGGRLNGNFVKNVTTLEKLIVNGIEQNSLKHCLTKNSNLKELTLYENSFISYFNHDLSKNINFQLTSLKVLDHNNQTSLRLEGEFPADNWTRKQRLNFCKFLSTQNHLKALHLDTCYADDLQSILGIDSLKLLEINKFIGNFPDNLTVCNNITGIMTNADISILENLSTFMPNIESMFIYKICIADFQNIESTENFRNISSFYYFRASENIHGRLVDLTKFYSGSVNIIRSTREQFIKLFGS